MRKPGHVSTKHPVISLLLVLIIISLNVQSSSSLNLRVASWNLLAQCYVKPSKYPYCDPQHMAWEHRKSLMVQRILHVEADIFCLQEVQVDLWPDLYDTICQHNDGYKGVIQNVTKGHNVGNAILIKKSCGLDFQRCESRSRALIGVLANHKDDRLLYVCNVHLEAGEHQDDNLQRFYQLKSLFKRLVGQIQLDEPKIKRHDKIFLDEVPIIMMGDFNMLRTNPLHTFLTQGLLQSPEQLNNLPAFRTIPLADAYLECPNVQEHFMASDVLDGEEESSSSSGILEDAKEADEQRSNNHQMLQRTYATGFVLDYILFSHSMQVQKTLLLHPMNKNRLRQEWPSADYPSDHLPVAADFEWTAER
ncbi:unnamed protein product [Cylindrotheca closterium]|uniref:Endonuclease/exonuclease/phosphatase domain-containing protein n=1 Tax=Cylindrotheca closterium TaxID=2856 RepID=A0AAD2CL99_9STRA|nr:unnamed protein product [Cylindrotheca closterium]